MPPIGVEPSTGTLPLTDDLPEKIGPSPATAIKSKSRSKSSPQTLRTTTSKKLESSSTPRSQKPKGKKKQPWRTRTLGRGADFHIASLEDNAWLWVAYVKGGFHSLPRGMAKSELMTALADRYAGASEVYILTAKSKEAGRNGSLDPVGLVATLSDGYTVRPKVEWFPMSSNRNKIEATLKWLHEMRKTRMPVFHVTPEDQPFFAHMCRYGVARLIGQVKNHTAPGVDAWEYQGVYKG